MTQLSAAASSFQADVRRLLDDLPAGSGYLGDRLPGEIAAIRGVYQRLGERGWLSLSWPQSAGGSGFAPEFEFVLWDELAYARIARPPLAAGIVAKTIISHGTDEQRQRFLPDIRSGVAAFSLGYSEPEAGSDLGGVRTRAIREGDEYIVTGEKRWTSGAHWADYLWLLCRTGATDSRGRGLTLLIVDMRSPGITINPLPTIDGGTLNEVFLDEVRVPAANRIGDEHGAWPLLVNSLAVERHVQFPPGRLWRDLDDIIDWVSANGLLEDAHCRKQVAQLAATVATAEAIAWVVLREVTAGRPAVGEAAANKLVHAAACQTLARVAAELGAPAALVRGEPVEQLWRQSILETIGGGTTEIMRSVAWRELFGTPQH